MTQEQLSALKLTWAELRLALTDEDYSEAQEAADEIGRTILKLTPERPKRSFWSSLEVMMYSTSTISGGSDDWRSGTFVLVTNGKEADVAQLNSRDGKWYVKYDAADCVYLRFQPTHWAPLPALPEAS